MYTQCPHCQTIFGVSEAHLSAAFGRVRCGHCSGQFNAKRHLLDNLPDQQSPSEIPSIPSVVDESALGSEPAQSSVAEIEAKLAHAMSTDEVDYIDLSNPITAPEPESKPERYGPARDINIEPPASPGLVETTTAPQIKNTPENQELDDIFASLDKRLEELSEDTGEAIIKPFEDFDAKNLRVENYDDAFGDPDSQTEEDLKTSIETIFAAAEAELIKTDIADDSDTDPEKEIPLDTFLYESNIELLGTDEVDLPEANPSVSDPQADDMLVNDNDEDIEIIELITDDDELIYLDDNHDEAVAQLDTTQASEPAFEQEELPFALHEELTAAPPPPRSWRKTTGLFSIIIILLLAISFQLALFRNVELANKLPALEPYLMTFCQYLPCQFTGQRDVKRVQLTSRDVRAHPEHKNTILISAIFVNNTAYDQPYPDILITLSDLTTTVVAQRRFTPQDYLTKLNAFQLMKSRKPVHITLEVLDPGNDAVNFQFEFL